MRSSTAIWRTLPCRLPPVEQRHSLYRQSGGWCMPRQDRTCRPACTSLRRRSSLCTVCLYRLFARHFPKCYHMCLLWFPCTSSTCIARAVILSDVPHPLAFILIRIGVVTYPNLGRKDIEGVARFWTISCHFEITDDTKFRTTCNLMNNLKL